MSEHTPLPWTIEFNDKSGRYAFLGKRGDGNVRSSDGYGFLFYLDASVREDADSCRFPRIDPEMAANVSLIFEAVSNYTASKARVAELESNEKAYEEIIGKMTYREVADRIADLESVIAILSTKYDVSDAAIELAREEVRKART